MDTSLPMDTSTPWAETNQALTSRPRHHYGCVCDLQCVWTHPWPWIHKRPEPKQTKHPNQAPKTKPSPPDSVITMGACATCSAYVHTMWSRFCTPSDDTSKRPNGSPESMSVPVLGKGCRSFESFAVAVRLWLGVICVCVCVCVFACVLICTTRPTIKWRRISA